MSHISQGEFSCRAGPADSVTFRARISGTSSRSASDMASLIRTWVQDGDASIKVGASRLHLDPTCDASLENIHDLDCIKPTEKTTQKPTETSTKLPIKTPTEKPTQKEATGDGSSGTKAVGILLGAIIAGLLLALLIVMIIIIVMWIKKIKPQT